MKKSKSSKETINEITDFVDKLTGKKEVNFFGEILKDRSKPKKVHNKSSIDDEYSDFDSAEDYAEEYGDDYDDEEEAMADYEDNY